MPTFLLSPLVSLASGAFPQARLGSPARQSCRQSHHTLQLHRPQLDIDRVLAIILFCFDVEPNQQLPSDSGAAVPWLHGISSGRA
jgi:hypothetical protein